MKNSLAPTYAKKFGDYWVLWYSESNSYSVVSSSFKTILYKYLNSDSLEAFKAKLIKDDIKINTNAIVSTIQNYLKDSNRNSNFSSDKSLIIDTSNRKILKEYSFNGKTIQVYYDSELVLKTIHPAIAHLTTETSENVKTIFDIYLNNENLCLFKNGKLISQVPKRDYHLIQGKFIMLLLCIIHDKSEEDWIGTFHGSTITDGISSILFIGESGKGKSTLCALLSANGFRLLADDVSPMLSANKHIYHNPSAISIKEGAFKIVQQMIPNFDTLPIVQFNKTKGPLRYIPCVNPEKNHYPCDTIVLVNYKNKSKTSLEKVGLNKVLDTLIPDSWLSSKPFHANQFLDWLESVNSYNLVYSDTSSVISEVSKLFDKHKKNF